MNRGIRLATAISSTTLILFLHGCVKRFITYTDGELISSKTNLIRTQEPEKFGVDLKKLGDDRDPILGVSVYRNKPYKEEWEDVYARIGVYETGDAYSGRTIIQEPTNETTKVKQSNVVDNSEALTPDLVKLTVNGVSVSVKPNATIVEFKFSKLQLDGSNFPHNASASIFFDGNTLDISSDFQAFVANEEQKFNQQRQEIAAKKDAELTAKITQKCLSNDWRACDEIPKKSHTNTDLSAYLSIQMVNRAPKFTKDMLYAGQAFEVFQKVNDGYLFSPSNEVFHDSFRPAFLKTKKRITPNDRFCAWLFYIGEYKYVGLDGFAKSIPAFRVYNGVPPSALNCLGFLLKDSL